MTTSKSGKKPVTKKPSAKKPAQNGGKRPGAGRKKGSKNRETLTKEIGREVLRQIVFREMEPMIAAQIANAKGIRYLVARSRSGRFTRIDRVPNVGEDLGTGHEIIEVWAKDPQVQAFTDLMNRALDKPKEQEQEVRVTGIDELVARITAGRARAASK